MQLLSDMKQTKLFRNNPNISENQSLTDQVNKFASDVGEASALHRLIARTDLIFQAIRKEYSR
jgi:hypothetical protein